MHNKGSNSSKKAISGNNAVQADNYRSENSKSSAVVSKARQGLMLQNMKEFKCEIDHEIAKCLDTLDRQGLKFLKQTLRASKIFGLNTQELGMTQPVEEDIEVDQQSPQKLVKQKEIPKKIQSKNNIQVKKLSKPEKSKKVQPIVKPAKVAEGKNDLNQKINKRLQGLNIKTGKKNQAKTNSKKDNPAPKEKIEAKVEIAEEIQVQEPNQSIQDDKVQSNSKESLPPNERQVINPVFYQSNKSWTKKSVGNIEQDQRQKEQQNQLLKPFYKKQFKKHHEEGKHHHKQHKDYGIQISKPEQFRRQMNSKIQEQEVKQTEEVFNTKNEYPKQSFQKDQKPDNKDSLQSKQLSPSLKNSKQLQNETDQNIQSLITAISRLSPSKRNKLEKIIERLQHSDQSDATSSLFNPPRQQVTYQKPYIAQRQSFAKNSEVKDNHSKSRSKLQKVEKATSLKGSFVKKAYEKSNLTPENNENLTPTLRKKDFEVKTPGNSQTNKQEKTKNNILEMYEDAQSQVISQNKKEQIKQSSRHIEVEQKQLTKSKEIQSSNNLSASYSSQFTGQNESGQKLIKISKKKSQLTNIVFKFLSNNGNSSIVGLTSIQIFNPQGQMILIDETNLKQPSPKLLKLFTENIKGQGWSTTLSNATISIDNITQQVAGIRIINWNKSQLEADRQADLMEIWINEQLHWRGQIKGGSYKDNEVYATNIKVMQKYFEFPDLKLDPSKSFRNQDKLVLKNHSIKNVKLIPQEPLPKKDKEEVCWLEKQTVQRQLKQLQEEQKKDEKIKRIGGIRNTVVNKNLNEKIDVFDSNTQKIQQKPFQLNWLGNQGVKQIKQELRIEPQFSPKRMIKPHHDDILGELSKGVDTKRKKQESSISIGKKKEDLGSRAKQESVSKKHQQYLLKKQKEQDEQFQKILQSMEQRSRPQEVIKAQIPKNKQADRQRDVPQNKVKKIAEKNLEDFMKDSLFNEQPAIKKFENKPLRTPQQFQEKKVVEVNAIPKKSSNINELDNLIDQLNDVVGGQVSQQTGEEFFIPQLPVGKQILITLLSNWGNQAFIGLNGLEIFDSEGESLRPIGISCTCMNSRQLYEKLFKQELLTSDQKMQLKFPKNRKISISLTLSERTQVAAIRIWNYNGHRVHNNIGVKKLHIKLDGSFIFSGQIQQSSGSSDDAYKYCQYILFTENNNILKRIKENDWLNKINRSQEEERLMFKTTLENFHRPVTRNDEEAVKKQVQDIQIEKQPIKLPKRQCFQYDPPLYPEGFVLKFVLHSSWGDRFFVGLNGIEVYNDKGENITNKNLIQIRADPSSIAKLEGYQKDKRIVNNLINGKNNTTLDSNVWLTPLLSDVQKIEKGRPNIILMEYNKANKIAGINFFNYIKTPERGVRQIEIFLDNYLLYRGYLRKYGAESGILHTTINFTKDQSLLEAMNYIGYNQDHLQQQIGLINEQKIVKANVVSYEANLIRPMTGKNSN